jgi:AbiV family abortive infection protein
MTSESKAPPYRGHLTFKQIAEGIQAIKRNAKRLHEDMQTLYDAKRFPTACSLGVLTIEEIGKLPILRRMALASNDDEWRRCWKDFTSHLDKSSHWIIPFILVGLKSDYGKFIERFRDERDPVLLNSLKQLGFYLGCYGKAHWSEPENVIEEENAELVILSANMLMLGSQPSILDLEEAIKDWAKHMSGLFVSDPYAANNAVVDFIKKSEIYDPDSSPSIPSSVAVEFMSTVIYLSMDNLSDKDRLSFPWIH